MAIWKMKTSYVYQIKMFIVPLRKFKNPRMITLKIIAKMNKIHLIINRIITLKASLDIIDISFKVMIQGHFINRPKPIRFSLRIMKVMRFFQLPNAINIITLSISIFKWRFGIPPTTKQWIQTDLIIKDKIYEHYNNLEVKQLPFLIN